ncbi:sensor histidine kinase [Paenibacillus brasilensis]|uniref:histidine kinase n=1 Tax=Paenibacillus brasilensis TaxID=128574 RepID=A0ABU0L3S3_9BACL|nr:HAMP domain-containing sensor histidine kinase [Paenibacillus brasilensis]MDQ0495923.1 signal transduction histidine kinase [Paenibacillus brasilensis]
MFTNIRRRLVILNTVVFLLVFSILGTWLYIHMQYQLYHDTDEVMVQAQKRFQFSRNPAELLQSNDLDPEHDEKIIYLFWSAQNVFLGQMPRQSFPLEVASLLKEQSSAQTIQTVSIGDRSYRALQFMYTPKHSNTPIIVCLIKSLQDVQRTLHSLMWDITAGIVIGGIIFVFAGIFLAGRALVPIRNSWEKQQRFVADASHEMRTPTAIIHAQTEMLLRHPTHSIEEESPHIAVILKESKWMGRLLEDLLTLARSDSNQLQIDPSSIELDSLLRELAEQFRLLADTKGINIQTDLQEPLLLWGDGGRVRQLLTILLDNALKYTLPNGQIKVAGRYQNHSVYISVSDSGCGIPEAELPHVFDRFYRGDKARSRTEGGAGLGLSIAQWIVEVHGGSIRVHSEINKGTQVELFFPRKKQQAD